MSGCVANVSGPRVLRGLKGLTGEGLDGFGVVGFLRFEVF